ncbi:peptidase family C78-domain-containing protein [Cercophora newfieldiana]|uniref:Peptidase family C78-domain-containing protein n=1 Tax=Cercophora newfieldiana TaxID=92897 RepID=A0AA39YHD0_9PEZI|nr:peptidase family C78-domain-containing protein [Cercophora newfieldiana]
METDETHDPIRDSAMAENNDEQEPMACPFCGWQATDGEYAMLLHMESLHPEGEDSPFVVKDDDATDRSKADEDLPYAECPVEGCGELLPFDTMDYHIELHAAEAGADLDGEAGQSPSRDPHTGGSSSSGPSRAHRDAERQRRAESSQAKAISAWKRLLRMPESSSASSSSHSKHHHRKDGKSPAATSDPVRGKRLGKSQLGKFAHEDRMPDWLVSLLQNGRQVESEGVVPVIAQLLEQCSSTKYAYICHPRVHHISKLKKEGGFCGYRNIQMMTSYVNAVKFQGYQNLQRKIPSIFQIQDFIESAWDAGINTQGRLETGGIKGTRKYIGTPEALAMFRLLDIPCDAQGFKNRELGKSEMLLMEYVENYFQTGVEDPTQRIRLTSLPPLYFQHAGHSMTIIGFEKLRSGAKNLIVFDPMFHDATNIIKLIGRKFEYTFPDMALKSYRRGSKYLRRYREFEVLSLRPPASGFPPV